MCTYLTDSVPDQNGSIELMLDGVPLLPDQWSWGSQRDGELVLLGEVCQKAAAEERPELVAEVVCGDAGGAGLPPTEGQ